MNSSELWNSSSISNVDEDDRSSYLSHGPLWMRIVAIVMSGTTAVVGGIGNLTILVAFATHRTMWTKQNIFLFCLTVIDLILTTVVNLSQLDQYLSGRWRHSHAWCRAFETISGVSVVTSLSLVALISRDRMLIVTKGATYDTYESARRKWFYTVFVVAFLLVFSISYTSLDILTGYSIFSATGRCVAEEIQSLYVTLFNQVIFPIPPSLFMLYYYSRVRRYIKQRAVASKTSTAFNLHTQRSHAQLPSQFSPGRRHVRGGVVATSAQQTLNVIEAKKADKIARSTRIMNVLLVNTLLSSIPSTIMSVMMSVLLVDPNMVSPQTFSWWWHVFELANMSCTIANAINPILYAYAMPSYKHAMKDVFKFLPVFRRIKVANHATMKNHTAQQRQERTVE